MRPQDSDLAGRDERKPPPPNQTPSTSGWSYLSLLVHRCVSLLKTALLFLSIPRISRRFSEILLREVRIWDFPSEMCSNGLLRSVTNFFFTPKCFGISVDLLRAEWTKMKLWLHLHFADDTIFKRHYFGRVWWQRGQTSASSQSSCEERTFEFSIVLL